MRFGLFDDTARTNLGSGAASMVQLGACCCAIIFALGLCPVSNAAAQTATFAPVTPGEPGANVPAVGLDDEEDEWIKEFVRLLRRLYEILGGDPNKLNGSPNVAMAQVTVYYVLHGVPGNLTHDQITEALADIAEMQTMLESPPSSVTPGTFPTVLAAIAAILD
jgi:hypothetical protein